MLTGTGGGVIAPGPASGFEPQDAKTLQTIATNRILTLMVIVQCNANGIAVLLNVTVADYARRGGPEGSKDSCQGHSDSAQQTADSSH